MKKIIAIISVITMLLALAVTPVSAATYDTSLDYAFGSGTGVKVFAASNASKTPTVDGKIEAGEYASSYDNTVYIPMKSGNSKISESFAASVGAADAKASIEAGVLDIEKLYKDSKLTFSFAEDKDNIYIAVKFDAGVIYNTEGGAIKMETFTPEGGTAETFKSIKHVLSRYALNYRIGFNMEDVDEYLEITTNMVWGDLMTAANAKVNFALAGASGQDIKSEGVVTAFYRGVVANETGYNTNALNSIVKQGADVNHQNPGTDYTVYDELCINKEALLKLLGDYSSATLEELPNAFYFTSSINGQIVGTKADGTTRTWLSSGGGGFCMFNGVKSEYEMSMNEVFPDLVVFTNKSSVTKADVKTGAPVEETTAAPTEAPTTEAPTEAPTTEAPTDAPTDAPENVTTDAATEAPKESGCGSTVTVAGIALVAALGTCAVFVEKKRK